MDTIPDHVYVTGTDTGIGKTHASAWLLRDLAADGRRVVGMKPVASGCVSSLEGWRSEDAQALIAASTVKAAYDDVNPYALPLPVAPEIAAREAGVHIGLDRIVAAHAALRRQADTVVVEGVGGWLAPLTEVLEQADVVRALKLPVLMVVGLRLGCIHQARATARAITADGCQLAGWIANTIDPAMDAPGDNLAILERVLGREPIAVLPWIG